MAFTQRNQGSKTVTAAGTAEPLSATSVGIREITIQAQTSNTDAIFIGNSSVDSTNGITLFATNTITLSLGDLNDIYVDSAVNGEGVQFLYTAS